MVELQDLLTHWASAQAFVMRWSQGKEKMAGDKVLQNLKHHDEAIRTQWSDAFRKADSGTTYSMIIKDTRQVAYSERQWNTDYRQLQLAEKALSAATSKATAVAKVSSPGKNGGEKRKADGSKKSGGREMKESVSNLGTQQIKVVSGRSFRGGDKQFYCKLFNSSKGCRRGESCRDRHHCDISVGSGDKLRACDGAHSRQDHTEADGAVQPARQGKRR